VPRGDIYSRAGEVPTVQQSFCQLYITRLLPSASLKLDVIILPLTFCSLYDKMNYMLC